MSKSRPLHPGREETSVEAMLPNFSEQKLASGCPAAELPFQKTLTVGATGAHRRQRGGLYSRRFRLSTPVFNFRYLSKTENLKPKIALRFQWLASCITALPRRCLSDARVIWATLLAVNNRK